MSMIILTLNIGSSSIKYKVFNHKLVVESAGNISGIATSMYSWPENNSVQIKDHISGLHELTKFLTKNNLKPDIICHRVVHGGNIFKGPTKINQHVISQIEKLAPLAPLHNPAQVQAIKIASKSFSEAKQLAFFDTAFHQTIPKEQYIIPLNVDKNIRNYGFHGLNYAYVTEQLSMKLNKPINAIICHLGNGASVCAVKNGISVATSMGMTPNSGLIMGTRSGNIDPGLIQYLNHNHNLTINEIDDILNKCSGISALSGSSDMREIEAKASKNDESSLLAIAVFVARVRFYLCGYMPLIQKPDCIVFTGGIGENSASIRSKILSDLEFLNISLNEEKNLYHTMDNLAFNDKIPVYIIKADEEGYMAIKSVNNY